MSAPAVRGRVARQAHPRSIRISQRTVLAPSPGAPCPCDPSPRLRPDAPGAIRRGPLAAALVVSLALHGAVFALLLRSAVFAGAVGGAGGAGTLLPLRLVALPAAGAAGPPTPPAAASAAQTARPEPVHPAPAPRRELPRLAARLAASPAPGPAPAPESAPASPPQAPAAPDAGSGADGRGASGLAPVAAPGPPGAGGRVYGEGEVDRVAAPLDAIRPVYPPSARFLGREGDVTVAVQVDARGRVRSADVAASAGDDFDASALDAVRRARFSPALRAGRAVASRVTLRLHFRLE